MAKRMSQRYFLALRDLNFKSSLFSISSNFEVNFSVIHGQNYHVASGNLPRDPPESSRSSFFLWMDHAR
jgi:hypothetical protein